MLLLCLSQVKQQDVELRPATRPGTARQIAKVHENPAIHVSAPGVGSPPRLGETGSAMSSMEGRGQKSEETRTYRL